MKGANKCFVLRDSHVAFVGLADGQEQGEVHNVSKQGEDGKIHFHNTLQTQGKVKGSVELACKENEKNN